MLFETVRSALLFPRNPQLSTRLKGTLFAGSPHVFTEDMIYCIEVIMDENIGGKGGEGPWEIDIAEWKVVRRSELGGVAKKEEDNVVKSQADGSAQIAKEDQPSQSSSTDNEFLLKIIKAQCKPSTEAMAISVDDLQPLLIHKDLKAIVAKNDKKELEKSKKSVVTLPVEKLLEFCISLEVGLGIMFRLLTWRIS